MVSLVYSVLVCLRSFYLFIYFYFISIDVINSTVAYIYNTCEGNGILDVFEKEVERITRENRGEVKERERERNNKIKRERERERI